MAACGRSYAGRAAGPGAAVQDLQGITALEINLEVVEIIEAAKESIRTGRAVKLK
jgi:predicted dehydrogenase